MFPELTSPNIVNGIENGGPEQSDERLPYLLERHGLFVDGQMRRVHEDLLATQELAAHVWRGTEIYNI